MARPDPSPERATLNQESGSQMEKASIETETARRESGRARWEPAKFKDFVKYWKLSFCKFSVWYSIYDIVIIIIPITET